MKHLENSARKSQAIPTLVETLPKFEDRLEALEDKYHNAIDQAEKFTKRLEKGERPWKCGAGSRRCCLQSAGAKPCSARRSAQGLPHHILRHNAESDIPAYDVQQKDISAAELRQLVAAAKRHHNA